MNWNKLDEKDFLKKCLDILESIEINLKSLNISEEEKIYKHLYKIASKIEYKLNQ